MAILKHISSKNAHYGDAEKYLTFEHGWGVTATRQNVTASGQSVRNGKPQRNSAVTLKLSSG